jgi:hypothetical protein
MSIAYEHAHGLSYIISCPVFAFTAAVFVIAIVVISRTTSFFERFHARSSNMAGVKATMVVLVIIVLCGEL